MEHIAPAKNFVESNPECPSPSDFNASKSEIYQQLNSKKIHPYFPLTPKDSSPESLKSNNQIAIIPTHRLNSQEEATTVARPSGVQLEQLAQLAQSAHLARIASSASFGPFSPHFAGFNPFLPRASVLLNPVVNPLLNLYGHLNTAPTQATSTIAESTSLYLRSREAISQLAAQHKSAI